MLEVALFGENKGYTLLHKGITPYFFEFLSTPCHGPAHLVFTVLDL